MAPAALLGRYKLYKTGTKKLVQWLAHSASRCCDLKAVVKSMGGSNTTSKRKDLAAVEIRTQELIKLAEAIASSVPPVDIPQTIIEIAEDVIAGREECAEWYASQALQGGSELAKENDSHRYFILVLQRVLKLLVEARATRPEPEPNKLPKSKNKKKRPVSEPSEQEHLNNLFSSLEVEEPSAAPLGDQAPTASTARPTHFRLENEEDDSGFATWCFLQDLNDVRSFVRKTWDEYSNGDISFLAASSITDTAFGLLRCADEEFAKISPVKSSGWFKILEYLGLDFVPRGRTVWLCPAESGTQAKGIDTKINPVELLCPMGMVAVQAYSRDAREICQRSHEGKVDYGNLKSHEEHACACHGVFGFRDFSNVLHIVTPEIHAIAHKESHCDHCNIIDEFVLGLVEVHAKGRCPMWVVVACQIYLDIYDVLGTHCGHGVDALKEVYRKNAQTATDLDEFVSEYKARLDDPRWQSTLDRMAKVVKWARQYEEAHAIPGLSQELQQLSVVRDEQAHAIHTIPALPQEMQQIVIASNQRHTHGESAGCGASTIERYLPAHAGGIIADLRVGMHAIGCGLANMGSFVLSMAHLYKHLRTTGLLTADWHDMDLVLAAFGTKQPLVAKTTNESDPDAAMRHYYMALGMSTADASLGRRRDKSATGGFKIDPTLARQITVTSPFLKGMSTRRMDGENRGLGTSKSKTVEIVLQTMATIATKAATDKKSGGRGSHLRASYTPLQLLTTFKKSLLADEPQLNFNYISFTVTCGRLLQTITDTVGPELGLKKLNNPGAFTHVVAGLLRSAASNPAVRDAATIIQDHIASGGKKFVKEAYDQSSGRIPKHLRPEIELYQSESEETSEVMRIIFDRSGTKYSFSGCSMAAYHPGIKPEACQSDCCKAKRSKGLGQSETDPHAMDSNGHPSIVLYGSAIPQAILQQGFAQIEQDPEEYLQARERLLQHLLTHNCLPDDDKCEVVMSWTGLQVVGFQESLEDTTPWAYLIDPDHEKYEDLLEYWTKKGCELEHGTPLPWPVRLTSAPVAAVRPPCVRARGC